MKHHKPTDYGLMFVKEGTLCAECGGKINIIDGIPCRFYKGKPYCCLECFEIGLADERAETIPIKKPKGGQ